MKSVQVSTLNFLRRDQRSKRCEQTTIIFISGSRFRDVEVVSMFNLLKKVNTTKTEKTTTISSTSTCPQD